MRKRRLKHQNLPVMQKGRIFYLQYPPYRRVKATARFTEGTLIAAMENPVHYMESGNKEMAKTLGATGGLGTVATRADIIEKIVLSFLLEKKAKTFILQQKHASFWNWFRKIFVSRN